MYLQLRAQKFVKVLLGKFHHRPTPPNHIIFRRARLFSFLDPLRYATRKTRDLRTSECN